MERDVGAIQKLLTTVQRSADDAETLAAAGSSLSERIQWQDAMMHFGHLIGALEWVIKNTESAIVKEAAEQKRREEVDAFWRESDARYRAKQAAKAKK
jgi:hypothetical protein